jgi:3-phosphoshikimate 1-carboxyvinyltransferase
MYIIKKPDVNEIQIDLPYSKSVTHRIYILSAFNLGTTRITDALDSYDTNLTRNILTNLGAEFEIGKFEILSKSPIGQVNNPDCFLGNSGSSARFLPPVATFVDKKIHFHGDKRLHERPFSELIEAMKKLGAKIDSSNASLPFDVYPQPLKGGDLAFTSLPSSQIVTGLMIAALWMEKNLTLKLPDITPSLPYIKMTHKLMKNLGLLVEINKNEIFVNAQKQDINWNFNVEKDLSAASYWVVFSLINNIKVKLKGVNLPSLQGDEKIFEIAELLGASVMLYSDRIEIEGEINTGINFNCRDIPDLVPALSILGLFAPEPIILSNIKHLEYKESNRVQAIRENINTLGGSTEYENNNLKIIPQKSYNGGKINTFNDHRIAMSFAVAGSKIQDVGIDNPDCVQKSYPEFWKDFYFWEELKS